MSENQRSIGMSDSEWRYREGKALTEHGANNEESLLVEAGQNIQIEALRGTAHTGMVRVFKDLFPGEEVPEDHEELRRRVDSQILDPEDFKIIYDED